MAALIKYPDFLDADSEEVGCIFEQACYRGETKCVKILLSHPKSIKIILAKDGEDKTGFIRACQMGREEIVSLLLNHPNSQQMFPIQDGDNMTGFMIACRWGKLGVVTMLLKQSYFKDLSVDYKEETDGNICIVVENEVQSGFKLAKKHGYNWDFNNLI